MVICEGVEGDVGVADAGLGGIESVLAERLAKEREFVLERRPGRGSEIGGISSGW